MWSAEIETKRQDQYRAKATTATAVYCYCLAAACAALCCHIASFLLSAAVLLCFCSTTHHIRASGAEPMAVLTMAYHGSIRQLSYINRFRCGAYGSLTMAYHGSIRQLSYINRFRCGAYGSLTMAYHGSIRQLSYINRFRCGAYGSFDYGISWEYQAALLHQPLQVRALWQFLLCNNAAAARRSHCCCHCPHCPPASMPAFAY